MRNLEDCLVWLDGMKSWQDNWNSYGALKPSVNTIEKAKVWLMALYALTYETFQTWPVPLFITGDGDGGIEIEWIHETEHTECLSIALRLCVFIDQTGIEYMQGNSDGTVEMPEFADYWMRFIR